MGNELQPDDGPGQVVSGHVVRRQQQIRNPELRRHGPLRAAGRRDRQAGQQRSALSGKRKNVCRSPDLNPGPPDECVEEGGIESLFLSAI